MRRDEKRRPSEERWLVIRFPRHLYNLYDELARQMIVPRATRRGTPDLPELFCFRAAVWKDMDKLTELEVAALLKEPPEGRTEDEIASTVRAYQERDLTTKEQLRRWARRRIKLGRAYIRRVHKPGIDRRRGVRRKDLGPLSPLDLRSQFVDLMTVAVVKWLRGPGRRYLNPSNRLYRELKLMAEVYAKGHAADPPAWFYLKVPRIRKLPTGKGYRYRPRIECLGPFVWKVQSQVPLETSRRTGHVRLRPDASSVTALRAVQRNVSRNG